jgi:hypothetical protein
MKRRIRTEEGSRADKQPERYRDVYLNMNGLRRAKEEGNKKETRAPGHEVHNETKAATLDSPNPPVLALLYPSFFKGGEYQNKYIDMRTSFCKKRTPPSPQAARPEVRVTQKYSPAVAGSSCFTGITHGQSPLSVSRAMGSGSSNETPCSAMFWVGISVVTNPVTSAPTLTVCGS